jgi:hypothetical protein
MEKLWYVKYELHGKEHIAFVNATSELDALMEARTKAKDWCNTCHVICIAPA